jgi:drug/metabolite transporter superfamily protein YnfA
LLLGGRVSRFRVGRDGGHIVTNRSNFLIALAPYFFPIYSILAIAIYGLVSIFYTTQPYGRVLYAVIGATWAFHFTFTCWMVTKDQTDLSDHGSFFSLAVIYLMNLILLSVMLVLASRQITFADFGADFLTNVSNFSHRIFEMFERFRHGAR